MSEFVIISLGFTLLFTGVVGCFLPILPGPPISFVALLLIYFSSSFEYSEDQLFLYGGAAAVATVLDYIVPVWGTKKFGGSKKGVWGSTLGLIAGLFFPPIGIIFGPFIGAVIGELVDGKETNQALKAGFGAFLGFLTGVGIKLIVSGMIFWSFIQAIW